MGRGLFCHLWLNLIVMLALLEEPPYGHGPTTTILSMKNVTKGQSSSRRFPYHPSMILTIVLALLGAPLCGHDPVQNHTNR